MDRLDMAAADFPGKDLFAGVAQQSPLDATVDGIRERFGKSLLTRASLLPRIPSGGSRHG